MKEQKPIAIARLYFDTLENRFSSEFGKIGFTIQLVRYRDKHSTPEFVSDYELTDKQLSSKGLVFEGTMTANSQEAFAYNKVLLNSNNPSLDEARDFVKRGNRLEKKLNAIQDKEGYIKSFADYLNRVCRALNVSGITSEAINDKTNQGRWLLHEVNESHIVVETLIRALFDAKGWDYYKAA